ncbi:MAG: hypothetical protein Q9Q40_00550 [Acidobacteriota bacterium]|nr:hypothetical protein [Acidobacteriota bacterium]
MHDGCSGQFDNGRQVADKVRMMGFDIQPMPMPLEIHCENCDKTFTMQTFLASCPHCEMVYAVTPCHAFDPANVMAAGVRY